MTPEIWKQVEELYRAVLDSAAEQREALLAAADPDLSREVKTLIAQRDGSLPRLLRMDSRSDSAATALIPRVRLGPYQLESLLGEGGMGKVFRARDTRLDRLTAIKVIRSEFALQRNFRMRFQREARATAALNHPHICTLYDIGEDDGCPFIVMEFLEGQTLSSCLREGPLPIDKLLRCALEIAEALSAAHDRGIIHRDLKPANLMVTPAGIKVLDFGLAKMAGAETALSKSTSSEIIQGTPAYMSPEQARGEELDPRSDLFSLGCLLYEASTGVRPFRGSSFAAILGELAGSHPAPPSSLRPELPAEWDSIIGRLMRKDRRLRYNSAADLSEALAELRFAIPAVAIRAEAREPERVFGREREFHKLETLLASALSGMGKVALVTGEPGIGKTALSGLFAYMARARNPGLLLARGACVEQYGAGEAYLLFLDALTSLFNGPGRERVVALLRRFAPTWCLQFPAVFSTEAIIQSQREATGATRERMLRELGDALAAVAEENPLVLLLEDLHWADPASVDMLRHLAGRARGQRLLIVGTARPEDVHRGNLPLKNCFAELHARELCVEIPLAVLDAEHIRSYLDSHFSPHDFPPELAAVIHRRSEGHPLFATGTIQLLTERGDIVRAENAWRLSKPLSELELEVPHSMRGMIEKKIGLLSDSQRQALIYASVEGEEFTSTVLVDLLETDELELEDSLHAIEKLHRLIQVIGEESLPDGSMATRYRFSHALYQYFLYEQLQSKRRALLHRRAGEALERAYLGHEMRIAAALATHFERGRDFSKSIKYLIQAGDGSVTRYAHDEAARYYTRGLDLIDRLAEENRVERRTVLLQKRAGSYLTVGRFKESAADHVTLLEISRAAGDQVAECRALIGLGAVANFQRDIDGIDRYGLAALALAERIGDPVLEAEARTIRGLYMAVTGNLQQAEQHYDRGIGLARSLGHQSVLPLGLMFRGVVHFWKGEYLEAESAQMEAVQLSVDLANGFCLPLALFYVGLTRANLGRLSEAMAALQQSADYAKCNNHAPALTRAPNGLGWLWREIGDVGKAIEFNTCNVEYARSVRVTEGESNALINLVYDYLLAGEPGKAGEALEALQPLYDREEWNRWRFFGIRGQAGEAEYWLSLNKLDRAEQHARTLLDNATRSAVPKYVAIAYRVLGEIAALDGDHNRAEAELTRSLDIFTTHPAPLVEWRNHVALARLLASRNRPAAARHSFARAEALVQRLAAGITDPALKNVFLGNPAVREVIASAAGN